MSIRRSNPESRPALVASLLGVLWSVPAAAQTPAPGAPRQAAPAPTEPAPAPAPGTTPGAAPSAASSAAPSPAPSPAPTEPPADPSWQLPPAEEPSQEEPPRDATQADEGKPEATSEATSVLDEDLEEEGAAEGAGEPRYGLPPPAEEPLPPTDYDAVPFTHHQLRWDIQVAARTSWIRSSTLDPFAEDDALTQLSFGFGRGLYRNDRFSLAALGVWEIGGKSARARGAGTSLSVQRFALALEGRYHFWNWLYGYGRLAPGALRTVARFDAPRGGFSYEARNWVVSADAALGAAVRLFGDPDGRNSGPRFWLFLEGGYGWSATQDLSLRPTAGAPERAENLELGELSLPGGYGRLGGILSF